MGRTAMLWIVAAGVFVLLGLWSLSLFVELQKSHRIEHRVKVIERFIGPQGKQGKQGKTGKTGKQGKSGGILKVETLRQVVTKIAHQQAIPGPRGFRGKQGVKGKQGIRGPRGYKGNKGPQGQKGATGIQGPAGPQGPQGPAGTFTCPAGFTLQTLTLRLNPQGGVTVILCAKPQ